MAATTPLFIHPVFKERVWGGTRLRDLFGDLVPAGTMGEGWVISGLPCNSGPIAAGPGHPGTLEDAWRAGLITGQPRTDDFPILVKFLDPTDWLSVQVHPDDDQAKRLEGQPRGKAECWYVIDCAASAELILGHDAQSAADLRAALDDGTLDEHLLRQPVNPGSFFMVPSGCVHAVGPGMLVYEVQQSSDITYRLYDFDRPGLDGNPRELHVDKGFSVVTAPYDLEQSMTAQPPRQLPGGIARTLVANDYFTVEEITVGSGVAIGSPDAYQLLTVVRGDGQLQAADGSHPAGLATSVVLPVGCRAELTGAVTAILTTPA